MDEMSNNENCEELAFDPRYMVGSEGGRDYIVIGTHHDLSVGIKAIVQRQNDLQIFIGLRVRIHHNVESPSIHVEDFLAENPTLFTWEKVSEERASSMFGALFGIPFGQSFEQIKVKLEEAQYVKSLIDNLSGMFPILVPMDEILAYLSPAFDHGYTWIAGKFEKMNKPENYDAMLTQILKVPEQDQ